jgi:hypothetical protein
MFAHYTLREEAFRATDEFLTALRNQDLDYVRFRWFVAMAHCRIEGRPFDKNWIPIEEIQLYCTQRNEIRCYVISMPEARNLTEACLVAVASTPLELRYFTLEKSISEDDTITVFCEWTKDGSHLNYGAGPNANVDDFSERIFNFMESELHAAS